jgi:hypothetical protein
VDGIVDGSPTAVRAGETAGMINDTAAARQSRFYQERGNVRRTLNTPPQPRKAKADKPARKPQAAKGKV